MGKFALITKLGVNDRGVNIDPSNYHSYADIKILVNRNANEIKFDSLFTILKRLKIEPSEIAIDLLVIASSMYAADTRINRIKFADDSWTREIDLFIPVSNPDIWNLQKDILISVFKFLTGDIWEINFRSRTELPNISPKGKLSRFGMSYNTDTVCLFSGGMDSFIGAINLLSNGVRPLLLGHAKATDVSPYQRMCEEAITTAYPGPLHRIYAFLRIPKVNLFGSEEKTERGRSFLFLALGGMCASALAPTSNLIVPENGLISLNLPLTPLRVGSHSTRTTHPYYLSLMQKLFDNLNLGVKISNPYQFKTKGEMLEECLNSNLVRETNTMSCSSPTGRHGEGTKHCGYCVPCLIRQSSFLKANLQERANNYKVNIRNQTELNSPARRDHIIAFKYLIEKQHKNPNYLKSLIRSTGNLGNDIDNYLNTYERGLNEVETLLRGVTL